MVDSELEPDALPNGYELHEYKIRAVLGRGGFGVTYIAEDVYLDHVVALKEYFPISFAKRAGVAVSACISNDSEKGRVFAWGLQRFIDEARILARCRHPNIVRVIRYFEANGTAYLVMDFETGQELGRYREWLGRPFTEAEIMALMMPLMEGLIAIHSAGFLHRDIKPDNILVRSDGAPVLLDFGAARQALGIHSALFTVIVTAGYAPIEQYSADGNQGPWTDVYALGAVFYWAVTGEKPPDALNRMRRDPYQPVSHRLRGQYSERLLAAIDIALMFDAADRFQTVEDWLGVLRGERSLPPTAAARLALPASPPPASPTARPPRTGGRDHASQLAFDTWRKSVGQWSSPGGPRPAPAPVPLARPLTRPLPPKPSSPPPPVFDGPVTLSLKPSPTPQKPLPQPRPPVTSTEMTMLDDAPSKQVLMICYGGANLLISADGRDYRIGRSSDNNLILTNPIASRHHAKIIHDGIGFRLVDFSKFGTVIHYNDGRTAEVLNSAAPLTGTGTIAFGGPPTDDSNTANFQCINNADSVTVLDENA